MSGHVSTFLDIPPKLAVSEQLSLRDAAVLTVTEVREAKPAGKPYELRDAGNMYLLVNRTRKYWGMGLLSFAL